MANNNNQDGSNKGGSFVRQAFVSTPLVAGAGISARNVLKEGTLNPSRTPAISTAIRTASGSRPSKAPPIINPQRHYNYMTSAAKKNWLSPEDFMRENPQIARQAWDNTLKYVDPAIRTNIEAHISNLSNVSDQDLASALSRSMRGNQDPLAQQGYRRFARSLNAYQGHLMATGERTLPTPQAIKEMHFRPNLQERLPSNLQKYIDRIGGELGGKKTDVHFYSRKGWDKAGFGVYKINMRTKFGNVAFEIPKVVGGILVEGTSQQTRRISPSIMLVDQGSSREMSRMEWFLKNIEEQVVTDVQTGHIKNQRELERAIKDVYQKTFRELEVVRNIPEGIPTTKAQRLYEEVRGSQTAIRFPVQGRKPGQAAFGLGTREQVQDIVREMNLKAGTSPTALAKDILQKVDLGQRHRVAGAADPTRRLEQPYREYETVSGKDIKARTLYLDIDQHDYLRKELGLQEGESITRKSFFKKVGKVQAAAHFDITQTALTPEALTGREFKPGELLGHDPITGEPITFKSNMAITGGVFHQTEAKGPVLRIHYMDQQKLESGAKFFKNKATMRIVRDQTVNRIIRRATNGQIMADDIDTIMVMKGMTKDTSLQADQLITGMETMLRRRQDLNRTAQMYLADPEQFYSRWERAAITGSGAEAIYNPERFASEAMKFARNQAGLSKEELDLVFGRKGAAIGIADLVYDAPAAAKGAGARGSIEPRAFETLTGGVWGEAGDVLKEDFARRLQLTNPEKLVVQKEISKTVGSFYGKTDLKGMKSFKIGREVTGDLETAFRGFLDRGGGRIETAIGLPDLYAPPADIATAFREVTTPTGKASTSLFKNYMDVIESAASVHSQADPVSIEEARRNMQRGIAELGQQWAPAGKGMGAIYRGKTVGSEYLRAMGGLGDFMARAPNEAYISENAMEQMFREMQEYGIWSAEETTQRRKILEGGGWIPGVGMRHPNIDQYSAQGLKVKVAWGEKGIPSIALHEDYMNLGFQRGTGLGDVKVQIGQHTGFASDVDGDNIVMSFLEPDTEKVLRKQILADNSEFTAKYVQHQVRMSLLQSGARGGVNELVGAQTNTLAAIEKLAATDKYVPGVSLEMSKMRRALQEFGQGEAAENARAFFTQLEQTPISGKHLKAAGIVEGDFQALMSEIVYASQRGGEKGAVAMTRIGEAVFGQTEHAARLLKEDLPLDPESAKALAGAYGVEAPTAIKSIGLREAMTEAFRARGEYERSGRAFEDEILRGRKISRAMGQEFPDIVSQQAAGIAGEGGGTFRNVVKAVMSKNNIVARAGRSAIRNARPLAMGFTASLALAATLSSPRDTIGPGSALTNMQMKIPGSKAANRMKPETVMPPGQTLGNPTAPNMLSSNTVRIDSASSYPQSYVRMQAHAKANVASMAAGFASQGAGIHLNLRDNRSSMSPRRISEKLME